LAQGEKERFFRGQQGEVGGAALAIRKYIVGCAGGTAAQALRIPREGLTSFLTEEVKKFHRSSFLWEPSRAVGMRGSGGFPGGISSRILARGGAAR
jgi:hypothetical protein